MSCTHDDGKDFQIAAAYLRDRLALSGLTPGRAAAAMTSLGEGRLRITGPALEELLEGKWNPSVSSRVLIFRLWPDLVEIYRWAAPSFSNLGGGGCYDFSLEDARWLLSEYERLLSAAPFPLPPPGQAGSLTV